MLCQVDYDPLGNIVGDSAPDFLLPFGFRCGVVDSATRLVVFSDGRSYDSGVGRWMVPDYRRLVASIQSLAAEPQWTNLYRAGVVLWDQQLPDIIVATGTRAVVFLPIFDFFFFKFYSPDDRTSFTRMPLSVYTVGTKLTDLPVCSLCTVRETQPTSISVHVSLVHFCHFVYAFSHSVV